jgi:hypothetical protein
MRLTNRVQRSKFIRVIAFGILALFGRAYGQAPTTASNTVFTVSYFNPDVHGTNYSSIWLRADGSWITLNSYFVDVSGYNPGPQGNGVFPSGTWSYAQDTSATGHLVLVSSVNNSPNTTIYPLTFTMATSGTYGSGPPLNAPNYGPFSLRPSNYGLGPSNISTLVSASNGSTTAGFVLPGTVNQFVLIRAVGPSLSTVGVAKTASGMGLNLFNSASSTVATGVNWAGDTASAGLYQSLFSTFGAFPLVAALGEPCIVQELAPGAYTAQMTATSGGSALIEVYFLP